MSVVKDFWGWFVEIFKVGLRFDYKLYAACGKKTSAADWIPNLIAVDIEEEFEERDTTGAGTPMPRYCWYTGLIEVSKLSLFDNKILVIGTNDIPFLVYWAQVEQQDSSSAITRSPYGSSRIPTTYFGPFYFNKWSVCINTSSGIDYDAPEKIGFIFSFLGVDSFDDLYKFPIKDNKVYIWSPP